MEISELNNIFFLFYLWGEASFNVISFIWFILLLHYLVLFFVGSYVNFPHFYLNSLCLSIYMLITHFFKQVSFVNVFTSQVTLCFWQYFVCHKSFELFLKHIINYWALHLMEWYSNSRTNWKLNDLKHIFHLNFKQWISNTKTHS